MDKISPELRHDMDARAATDKLDVIVELQPLPLSSGTRDEKIGRLRAAFAAEAAPVKSAVAAAGGQVLGEAWLNQTLRCRLPSGKLDGIAALPEVKAVDKPRILTRDS